jgi:hypothetical protein
MAILAVALTGGLWWSYFVTAKPALDQAIRRRQGVDRSTLARDMYSILHFPLVFGVVLVAVAIEEAVAHPHQALPVAGSLALAEASSCSWPAPSPRCGAAATGWRVGGCCWPWWPAASGPRTGRRSPGRCWWWLLAWWCWVRRSNRRRTRRAERHPGDAHHRRCWWCQGFAVSGAHRVLAGGTSVRAHTAGAQIPDVHPAQSRSGNVACPPAAKLGWRLGQGSGRALMAPPLFVLCFSACPVRRPPGPRRAVLACPRSEPGAGRPDASWPTDRSRRGTRSAGGQPTSRSARRPVSRTEKAAKVSPTHGGWPTPQPGSPR